MLPETKQPGRFARLWRSIGGGSLTLSILIHVGLLVLAGFIVFATQTFEKQVDFLPGGGTQQGAAASSDLAHKVQMKRQQALKKTPPMQRLVSTSINATLTLPESPPNMLDLPDVSSMMGGGSLGSGGYGTGGAGGGFGNGQGMGGMSGMIFKPLMMFGKGNYSAPLAKQEGVPSRALRMLVMRFTPCLRAVDR